MAKSTTENGFGSYSVDFRVRYAECDPMGYLNHAKYWEYFEVARTGLLRQNGFSYRDLEAEGICFVVSKAVCKYLLPIYYDDLVTVKVGVNRITHVRVEHSYTVFRDGTPTCEASTTLACVGRDGRLRAMPEALWSCRG